MGRLTEFDYKILSNLVSNEFHKVGSEADKKYLLGLHSKLINIILNDRELTKDDK